MNLVSHVHFDPERIQMSRVLFLLCLCAMVGTAQATTIEVPADYSAIQDAIVAADPGDTILVAP